LPPSGLDRRRTIAAVYTPKHYDLNAITREVIGLAAASET